MDSHHHIFGDIYYHGKECAYCLMPRRENDCSGCPINIYTGFEDCRYTPWVHFHDAVVMRDRNECRIQAIRMRDFILYTKPKEFDGRGRI
jgi:hypothetical protein